MSPLTRIALVALLVGCDAATRPDNSVPQDTTAPTPPPPAPLTSTGTIAYTSLNELRLIESNGSGDHLVWAAPPVPQQSALHYTLTGTAWRPDGGEIAFSSDHEAAISIFANDIYAVRPDGVGLRRVTNAPALASYAAMKKGTVRVSVQNVNAPPGPYFIYVQGAPEPQLATISAGTSRVFTFTNVADFGSATQLPVAINGAFRYIGDAAVDVQPNQTVDAGSITITAFGGIEGYDATDPFWRADGTKVGYLGPLCFIEEAPSAGAFGYTNTALLDRETFKNLCIAEWGPTSATANQLLVVSAFPDDAGLMHVYRVTEGGSGLGAPILSVGGYPHVPDLHWLKDGSGFVIAKDDDLLDRDVNLWEFKFGSSQPTKLTDFHFAGDSVMRRFSMSPDGSTLVFEKTGDLLFGASDLWIAERTGANARLLKANAGHPAWNPVR